MQQKKAQINSAFKKLIEWFRGLVEGNTLHV